jgi:hypothetical protein
MLGDPYIAFYRVAISLTCKLHVSEVSDYFLIYMKYYNKNSCCNQGYNWDTHLEILTLRPTNQERTFPF